MSKAQTLIEQFYQEEIERKAQEATFTPLDVTVSSADMAVISTISKRFSKDKNLLVREAIGQALLDMFSALDPVERKILAKDADELAKSIATEIAEEQGLDSLEVSGTNWVQQDKNCVKEERKAEKELAQQQAMAAKMVLSPDTSTEDTSSSQEPELHTTEADTEDDSSAPLESSDTSESPEATEETSEQETDSKSIFG
jgi:hypothetical protein